MGRRSRRPCFTVQLFPPRISIQLFDSRWTPVCNGVPFRVIKGGHCSTVSSQPSKAIPARPAAAVVVPLLLFFSSSSLRSPLATTREEALCWPSEASARLCGPVAAAFGRMCKHNSSRLLARGHSHSSRGLDSSSPTAEIRSGAHASSIVPV